MELNTLVVFDLETSSTDIHTTQILSIAAVAIDMVRLEEISGSVFNTLVKPEDESKIEAGALMANKLSLEDLRNAPPIAVVWQQFISHVRLYNSRGKSTFTAPYAGGKNIRGFDLPILDRYCTRFKCVDKDGVPNLFNRKWVFDLEDDIFRWLGQTEELPDMAMDTIRKYFGMDTKQAHSALGDTKQTADLICRFFKLYRNVLPTVRGGFKRAYKGT